MNAAQNLAIKSEVRRFWEDTPCGARGIAAPMGTPAFYAEVERGRDRIEPFIARFADFAGARGQRVLDVGMGLGTDLVKFARAGAHTTGIDFTPRSVDLVKRRLALEGLSAEVLAADAEDLPFQNGQFDRVFAWGVFHHTPDPGRAIAEAIRVLRPGGELCLMVYARRSWVAYALWLRYGLVMARPRRTVADVLAAHMESIGTRGFTATEVRALLSGVDRVRIERVATASDRRVAGPVASFTARWLGWFLVVRARRAVPVDARKLSSTTSSLRSTPRHTHRARPRVVVHASALRSARDGARTVLTSLARELPRAWPQADIYFSVYDDAALPEDGSVHRVSLGRPAAGWRRRLEDYQRLPSLLRRIDADILIMPHEIIPRGLSTPVVVLAQNLIYHLPDIDLGPPGLLFARLQYQARRIAYRRQMPRAYARADAVIAVSRHTADRLAAQAGLDLGRTVVIPEGADALPVVERQRNNGPRQLVMVGTLAP